MIAFLKGVLAAKTQAAVYVDVGGIGYKVSMPEACLSKLPEVGTSVEIFTSLQVRDDKMLLFGFLTSEEKVAFEQLIGVSGVGPKVALAALSSLSPAALAHAIATQDTATIQQIPGIGKKTASRIILELKGSFDRDLGKLFGDMPLTSVCTDTFAQTRDVKGVCDALLALGFTSAEVNLALQGSPEGMSEGELLQYALKRLGE